jgi:hypothetical protein
VATVYEAAWSSTLDPNGTRVLWRALTWKEFKTFSEKYGHIELTQIYPMGLYMEIYELLLVAGPHPSEVTAGIAANVALQQLQNNPYSGDIDAVVSKLVEKRNWIKSSYLEGCRAVVAATFHIPFETMDTWEPDTLFERFAQAEHAVGMQWNPADPRAAVEPDKQSQSQSPQRPVSQRELAYRNAKERRARADREEQGLPGQTQGAPEVPRDESFSWRR